MIAPQRARTHPNIFDIIAKNFPAHHKKKNTKSKILYRTERHCTALHRTICTAHYRRNFHIHEQNSSGNKGLRYFAALQHTTPHRNRLQRTTRTAHHHKKSLLMEIKTKIIESGDFAVLQHATTDCNGLRALHVIAKKIHDH